MRGSPPRAVSRAAAALGLAAAIGLATAPACGSSGGARQSPLARENQLPGDRGWDLRQRAAPGQLEAYAGSPSVNHGETVDVHARADGPHAVRWTLYRMGWYGGAEGRRYAAGGPASVGPQPVPAADPGTGRVECAWPVTFSIPTDAAWPSGVFLVVLTRDDGPQTWVPVVIRADDRSGAAVVQLSVATWQAYNAWGGRSLYPPYGKGGDPTAVEVSFDRPYDDENGAGQYFRFEHFAVRWLEAQGYDAVYVTNVDLDRDPGLLDGHRIFLSLGHDEYWSARARDALEAALGRGMSAAFLSGNSMFWQVRFEASRAGTPRRTLVCWKALAATRDPQRGTPLQTSQWRDPPLSRPENAVLGVLYTAWLKQDAAWIVASSGHWIYEGTGVHDGDAIPGIVGYETDRRSRDEARYPTPPGTVAVSSSPIVDVNRGPDTQEGAVRDTGAGGFVFAAGTIEWPWGLSRDGVADGRVQRMTDNVLRRAGVDAGLATGALR
jgi:hypothetical protein